MGNLENKKNNPAIGNGKKINDGLPNDGLLGQKDILSDSSWHQVSTSKPTMEDFDSSDWTKLDDQKNLFYIEHQAQSALNLLRTQENLPSFGYQISNYRHSLQAATMALRAGEDEELVVCTLFHDVGIFVCPDNHGEFTATMLANYISGKNFFLLKHHQLFLDHHAIEHPFLNKSDRESFKGHPHFQYLVDWVEKYDQNSIQSNYDTAPLYYFEPMVHRFFEQPSFGKT